MSAAALRHDQPVDCGNTDADQEGIVFTCQANNKPYSDHEDESADLDAHVAYDADIAGQYHHQAKGPLMGPAPGTENFEDLLLLRAGGHRRNRRDHLSRVSERMICNLAARAGVVAVEQSVFEEIRGNVRFFTDRIIRRAVARLHTTGRQMQYQLKTLSCH